MLADHSPRTLPQRDDALVLACVQSAWTGDRATHRQRLVAGVERAAAAGAQLVCLEELHESAYFCQVQDPALCDLAEAIPGPSTDFYGALAARCGVVLVTSLFERRAPGLFHNTAVVLDRDGRFAGIYRKMHIPQDPGFEEKFYFTPGDPGAAGVGGFAPIDTSLGRIGVLVCWDQWYPEAARLMALAGAEVLLYPTAIGWNPDDAADERVRQRAAWMTIQRAHAVANGVPVVVANRTGTEPDPSARGPGIRFWGSSFIAGPQGELLAEASCDASADGSPEVLVARVSRRRCEAVRRIWPFLRDRRIDAYGDLTKRFR